MGGGSHPKVKASVCNGICVTIFRKGFMGFSMGEFSPNFELRHSDCIAGMQAMEPESVVTSPPYISVSAIPRRYGL